MELTIKHGISNSQYLIIAQPKRRYDEPRIDVRHIVYLEDPKTGDKIKTEMHDYWTANESQFETLKALALLAYGWPIDKLKAELIKKYPELQQNFIIEYWLLKRI